VALSGQSVIYIVKREELRRNLKFTFVLDTNGKHPRKIKDMKSRNIALISTGAILRKPQNVKMPSNNSMDVRAKQLLSYQRCLSYLACVRLVSPHVISAVRYLLLIKYA
jgi:hypothetical protein